MANTIKLKTGSGSDPSASDLIVGEIAIRTDSGKLFTKKDNGSVAEISGSGGGIDDGDKGDITVSNGGDTFTIDNGVVTSAKIADGTIVNGDIAAGTIGTSRLASGAITNSVVASNAAIAGSKISPDFGSQNITTNGNFIIESTLPRIYFTDTNNNDDFLVQNNNGQFQITDATNSNATRFAVNSDGHVDVTGNLDVGAGVDVTGNISCSGTIDGRDVAADGTKLDGIEASATADQTAAEIRTLVESASDSNVFTDADHSKLNGIEASATADQTASDIKTLLNSSGLVNAQIDASAAIAGTKISPDFGSQAITTTGNCSFGDLTLENAQPSLILSDNNAESDFALQNRGGVFTVRDIDNNANRLEVATDGTVDIAGNLDANGGLDVTGNITVTGTVDGVDIATRDTLFGGLTSSSGVLSNGVTATTQSAGNNTTRVATTAFVTTAVSNIVDSAPSALNTLNELAAALGDDANFSTTVTNSIGTKMPLAGGEFTGNVTFSGSQTVDGRDLSVDGSKLDGIESGATADQTASEILTLIKTVDGAGSGLDADTLDGISSASFVRSDASDTLTGGTYTLNSSTDQKIILSGSNDPYIRFQEGSTNKAFIQWHSDGYLRLQNQEAAATVRIKDDLDFTTDGSTFNSIFHEGNLTVGDGGLTQNNFTNTLKSKLDGIAASATNVTNNNQLTNGAGYITATLTNEQVQDIVGGMVSSNTESGITVTYQDGDGTLDFSVASQTDNNFTNADHSKLDGIEAGATADQSNSEIKTAYEANSDTNAFTDALLSKLNGIASSATNVTNNNQLTNGAGYITSTLTQEQVEDFVGGMLTGNTESGITVTYQDSDGTIDFVVGTLNQDTTGNAATATALETARTIAGVSFDGSANISLNNNAITNGAGYITATLTNEQVQDIVGGMVSGNTESGITVTYQDSDGTLDFTVGTLNQNTTGNAATATQLANARTIAGVSFNGTANISLNNNAITNGAGYVTSSVINSLNASNLSSGTIPDARFPSTLPAIDGSNLTGISAGATGGGSDEVFYENDQAVTTNYTITNGKNAMAAGPITINSGVTVTVGSGETLTIV